MEGTRREFIKILQEEYSNYCKARGEEETIKGYSEYIINRNIITDKTVNRFFIISKYPEALHQSSGIKKMAIYTLQDFVSLSCLQIRTIIKKYSTHFKLKNRLIP
jgi:hypothetical protein